LKRARARKARKARKEGNGTEGNGTVAVLYDNSNSSFILKSSKRVCGILDPLFFDHFFLGNGELDPGAGVPLFPTNASAWSLGVKDYGKRVGRGDGRGGEEIPRSLGIISPFSPFRTMISLCKYLSGVNGEMRGRDSSSFLFFSSFV
jgi:hypothetical protein